MKPKKTTQEDYDIFVNEIKRLLKLFHIDDWHVYYDLCTLKGANATCTSDITARGVTFRFGKSIFIYTPDEIKNTALHEVCHLLLANLSELADSRFVTRDELQQADESVAEKLTTIFKELGV